MYGAYLRKNAIYFIKNLIVHNFPGKKLLNNVEFHYTVVKIE